MTQAALVSPHDGVGTNIFGHVLRGRLMRVVPRTNEAINETWIADRDRYSYEGVYSADRLEAPHGARKAGEWKRVTWEEALEAAARGLKARRRGARRRWPALSATRRRALSARPADARARAPANIDHRLRQPDFRDQAADPAAPALGGLTIAGIDQLDALLVVGSQPAPRGAGAGAPRAQGRQARRQGRVPESGALRLPVPGRGVSRVVARAASSRDLAAIYSAVLDGAAAPGAPGRAGRPARR